MTPDIFWELIEASASKARGDGEAFLEALAARLEKLPAEEVRGFRLMLDRLEEDAFTWDLWGAAYVMNGGCSDDGFDYWRPWLIAQGRKVYEDALKDPESLAKAKLRFGEPGEYEMEGLTYTPLEVYEELTEGEEMELPGRTRSEPAGTPWEEDDLPEKFPKLWKKFGDE